MAIRAKTVVTVHLDGACVSHSRTDVHVRDRVLVIDEPEERGGTNAGPSPTETHARRAGRLLERHHAQDRREDGAES